MASLKSSWDYMYQSILENNGYTIILWTKLKHHLETCTKEEINEIMGAI